MLESVLEREPGAAEAERLCQDPPRAAEAGPPSPPSTAPQHPLLPGMATSEIEELLVSIGQPRYRGRQVAEWIFRKNAGSFDEMTNLPAALRRRLADAADTGRPEVIRRQVGEDGTTKYLARLRDGESVECVWLPYQEWASVCLSSQVGCPMACAFCATGMAGFKRNLQAGEIVAQFLLARAGASRPTTHIVFMGMGEPMLNYHAVMRAARLFNTECGVGARNMTISTVGIVPGIRRLAQEGLQINLALSLHGPDDETRARFMPVAQRYPLPAVMQAIRDYITATHRKVTLEYLLLAGVNDSRAHADKLARLLLGREPLLCTVNLIPYNETGTGFHRPAEDAICAFMDRLQKHGVSVTRRLERGHEIAGACGQLRGPDGSTGYRMKPRS